jgi:hypothetical protein
MRDKQAREDLLSDIRRIMAVTFDTPNPTGALTEDKILEILRPLLTPDSMMGKYFRNHILSIDR